MERVIIVHYHEIALKRGNRPRFVARLVDNITRSLDGLGARCVKALMGRIGIFWGEDLPWEESRKRLERVFGISNFSPAYRVNLSIDDINKGVLQAIKDEKRRFRTFAVKTKRGFKGFKLTSPEINARIGEFIRTATSTNVNLKAPDLSIFIEILPKNAYFYFDKIPGPSGIPAGISGRVCCLISGGIDSPVAAWRMMKRGCEVLFVHFHSYPYLDKTTQEKVTDLVRLLTSYQLQSTLYLVPFGDIQREISVKVEPACRVVLYRRMMIRIAERIAEEEDAKALVTGESIGQVASQTLDNLSVIESAVDMPILRPLIGMDKDEIICEAKGIGTFETSTIPDQDCCQLFVPRHPATKTRARDIEEKERVLDLDVMIERAKDTLEKKRFHYP